MLALFRAIRLCLETMPLLNKLGISNITELPGRGTEIYLLTVQMADKNRADLIEFLAGVK